MKLPKQWKHWCQCAGLSCYGRNHRYHKYAKGLWVSLKGHGRHWRINCHDMFQMSEKNATFDRWANSLEAESELPKSKDEFVKLVKHMRRLK